LNLGRFSNGRPTSHAAFQLGINVTFRRLLFPIVDIHIGDLDIPMYREIALRPDHAQSLARFLVCPLWVVDSIGQRNTC